MGDNCLSIFKKSMGKDLVVVLIIVNSKQYYSIGIDLNLG